jgi:hypothetical protein
MKIRRLATKAQVMDALFESGVTKGSSANKAFANFISFPGRSKRGDQHASNYRNDACNFPTDSYRVVIEALARIHCEAPSSLWDIVDPKQLRRAS